MSSLQAEGADGAVNSVLVAIYNKSLLTSIRYLYVLGYPTVYLISFNLPSNYL